MDEIIADRRTAGLTVWVGPDEVMRAMNCKRSKACEYMREALGRQPGEGGLLRVPVPVWEQFILRKHRLTASTRIKVTPPPGFFDRRLQGDQDLGGGFPAKTGSGIADDTSSIRVTQPRVKKL